MAAMFSTIHGGAPRPPAPAAPEDAEPTPGGSAAPLAPAWGWKIPDGGRAVHVAPGPEYQATTSQLCGLFPFVAGSGTPVAGTPVGRHQLWGEVVCLDPLAWLRAGLVTNPGMFVLGQPGTGKSALVKRLVTGAVAAGTRPLILGDAKPDYTALIRHLGGQVIRIGRGLDKINPLDAGPLGSALQQMTGPAAGQLRQEVRSRRLSLLLALATLIREARLSNSEEVILGRAIDLLDNRSHGRAQPTVTDVLAVIEEGPDALRSAARASAPHRYAARVADLVFTLDLLCTGSLAGVFDGATSQPIDLDAPAVSVDISSVRAAGDKLLTAAMLCTWSYGFGCVDAASALADLGAGPRRSYLGSDGRAVAGLARRAGPGRARRLPDPAEPGQGHGQRHDHPLAGRSRRPGYRGGPGQGTRVHGPVRDHRPGRPAAAGARPGERDHPAYQPRTGAGGVVVGTGVLPARCPPSRPRQIPHQDGRTSGYPGSAQPGRSRAGAL